MKFVIILIIFINILQVFSQSKQIIEQNSQVSSDTNPSKVIPTKTLPPNSESLPNREVEENVPSSSPSTKTLPTKTLPSPSSVVIPSSSSSDISVQQPTNPVANSPVTKQVTVIVTITTVSQIVTNGQTVTTVVPIATPVSVEDISRGMYPNIPLDGSNLLPSALSDANGMPLPSQIQDPNAGIPVQMGNNRSNTATSNNNEEEEGSNMFILIVGLLIIIAGIVVSDLFFCHRIYVNKKEKRQRKNIDKKVAKQIERIQKENNDAQENLTISIDTTYSDTNSKKALISPNSSVNTTIFNALGKDNLLLKDSPNLSESSQNVIDIHPKNNNNYNTFTTTTTPTTPTTPTTTTNNTVDNINTIIDINNKNDNVSTNNNNNVLPPENNNIISSINDLAAQSQLHLEQNTNEQQQTNNESNSHNTIINDLINNEKK